MTTPSKVEGDLALVQGGGASWDQLVPFARSGPKGVRGAALMALGRRFPEDPRTVALLEELATGLARRDELMGRATVGHVCLLLLREMRSGVAQATFARLRSGWTQRIGPI